MQEVKQQMLSWADQFNVCCFLDNHQYDLAHHSVECLLGVGVIDVFEPSADFFASLNLFTSTSNDWIFGHFSYDCKNYIEALTSNNPDHINFPDCFLFVPQITVELQANELKIGVVDDNAATVFVEIIKFEPPNAKLPEVHFQPRIPHGEYLQIIEKLKQHIRRGDCYEINFCQEFYCHAQLSFIDVYRHLQQESPNPFSAYYKIDDKHLACASPERYIQKVGNTILSQPIKGTAKRHADSAVDEQQKQSLQASSKDRSENVMIVDLVRNDLSKVCDEGSVKVDELMGVYSFPNVHQMISTISGKIKAGQSFADIFRATFPMGSMTGAPKKKVMQLMEHYEVSRRGIFSGSVGYISPNGDLDFNVVIRSVMYNSSSAYMSYHVGGAITFNSDPQQEYEECRLKASAIEKIFREQKKETTGQ